MDQEGHAGVAVASQVWPLEVHSPGRQICVRDR
jgi:hypothetical protein